MSESNLSPGGYSYAQNAPKNVSNLYGNKGLYSAYGGKPFSNAQDSISYDLSYGEPYMSEAASQRFGFYTNQGAASTNNGFSENGSELFTYGENGSTFSGRGQGIYTSQAESVAKPQGPVTMQQGRFGEKFFPSGNMNDKKNLGEEKCCGL